MGHQKSWCQNRNLEKDKEKHSRSQYRGGHTWQDRYLPDQNRRQRHQITHKPEYHAHRVLDLHIKDHRHHQGPDHHGRVDLQKEGLQEDHIEEGAHQEQKDHIKNEALQGLQ